MTTENVTQLMQRILNVSPEIQSNILTSVVILILLAISHRLILKLIFRRVEEPKSRYRWRKTSGYAAFLIGVLLVGRVWLEGFHSLVTFAGLLSAGIAIALRDLMANLAGWVFIIWRRPFEVGDRIQTGEYAGDVIDLRIFQFTLMEIGNWVDADQSTGRVIHLPNGRVFTEALANYTKGFQYIWNEIPVLLTFESNWKKAKEILQTIVEKDADKLSKAAEKRIKRASKKFMISYSKLTPIVYTSVKDCGVLLTMRYLCEPHHRRGTSQAIWEDVLEEFAKHDDIDFAYPTQRFFNNTIEGKAALRPD